jgi:hypothetical protein
VLPQPEGARRPLRSLQCASTFGIAQGIERALTLPAGPPRPLRLLDSIAAGRGTTLLTRLRGAAPWNPIPGYTVARVRSIVPRAASAACAAASRAIGIRNGEQLT